MLIAQVEHAVSKVNLAHAFRLNFPPIPSLGGRILVFAMGEVPTSGWSRPRLAQRFYVTPPADGIQEFDFLAEPPSGIVAQVVLPIAAQGIFSCPDWMTGIRVIGAQNSVTVVPLEERSQEVGKTTISALAIADGHVIVKQNLATYDDSFQPIGMCSMFSIKMKKLRHNLELTVTGPDEARIRHCIEQATVAGLIAAIIAAYATGGAALPAAISAFVGSLESCLGSSFQVRVDNRSHWIEWCT